ncbi:hypothetical protein LOK49_LG10G01345 [Camellia lanceoleosa]|uniref:Uncharacterized protein n=1 Tax=Camellia lanceoleosa TaxID=1840588 RepID=A0ACC0GA70_9ERIC|nr:hypothetical protein LOK49_LG10G01345 [Camellia lanceoleosa]
MEIERVLLTGPSTTHPHHPSSHIQLQHLSPLPFASQNFLNLKSGGEKLYTKRVKRMSRRGNGPRPELKLNLSPPQPRMRGNRQVVESPRRLGTVSPTSPQSSCVSWEQNQDYSCSSSSTEEATSMMLVGCPRCFMYVMLAEEDPRCPKCKSTVLLDVLRQNTTPTTTPTPTPRKT